MENTRFSELRIQMMCQGRIWHLLKSWNKIECKDSDYALLDFTQINLSGGTLSLDGNLELLGDLWKGNELSKNLTLSGGSKQVG